MRRLTALILATCLALSAPACVAIAGSGETVRLSPDEARATAARLLAAKQARAARAILVVLAEAHPDDFETLAMLVMAEIELGQVGPARLHARALWDMAGNDDERFIGALMRARALDAAGHALKAQAWLRRAHENATTERARRLAAREFRKLADSAPLRLSGSAGAHPSSNINGGTSETVMVIAGLPFVIPPEMRAISGYEFQAELQLDWRLSRGAHHLTTLGFSGSGRLAWDSTGARAPRYDRYSGGLSLEHRWQPDGSKVQWRAGFSASHALEGAGLAKDTYRLDGGATFGLGPGKADASAYLLHQTRSDGAYTLTLLGGAMSYRLGDVAGGTLTLAGGLRRGFATLRSEEYIGANASLAWSPGAPVLGADWRFSLAADQRDYGFSPYSAQGRHVTTLTAQASATLRKISYLGFSPTISATYEERRSNIALYSGHTLNIGMGIASNF